MQEVEREEEEWGMVATMTKGARGEDEAGICDVQGRAQSGAGQVIHSHRAEQKDGSQSASGKRRSGVLYSVQGAVAGVTKELPVPVPLARAIGDKDILANGLLNNSGSVSGVPIRRGQDPLTSTVLDMSNVVRDDILDLKTQADNAAGSFVKNMYSKHGQIETKRALNLPSSGPNPRRLSKMPTMWCTLSACLFMFLASRGWQTSSRTVLKSPVSPH
ncbi:hypothetical protein NDA15_003639 [Ustilago hordei]|nr:hypothetical protein NDA15_003639 [Ustilago hordei]UTT89297.1 hypothetical protein NDA17_003889 [Ustilago hordei]